MQTSVAHDGDATLEKRIKENVVKKIQLVFHRHLLVKEP